MNGASSDFHTTLSLTEIDEINLKIDEALSMAEILSYSVTGMREMGTPELIYTYFSMLEAKVAAIKESFKQATARNKEAA